MIGGMVSSTVLTLIVIRPFTASSKGSARYSAGRLSRHGVACS
jgi:Cu/Ag efflux pump CusA